VRISVVLLSSVVRSLSFPRPIPADGEPSVELYNDELSQLAEKNLNTWFSAPWLYAEGYLYRLLRSYFVQTQDWSSRDPFYAQKIKTFQHSATSIFKISTTMHGLDSDKEELRSDPEKLKILFNEMIQMCLWGNATDLSLLTHLSEDDIRHLQSVGKDAQAARKQFILKDDQEVIWNQLKSLRGDRIDFVLDNSGFELFTDLVFADFLVTYTPYVSKVVFHPKLIPWFVSDVTPVDFKDTFKVLGDPTFFPADIGSEIEHKHLDYMVSRWNSYLEKGIFSLSVSQETPLGGGTLNAKVAEYWTTGRPYWDMETEAPELFASLVSSGLVIFKGDANYRKLTGDVRWPAWTSFGTALGPLAGCFPLVSLRTIKADVVVGVDKAVAERLDKNEERWRFSGRYALVSFVPLS